MATINPMVYRFLTVRQAIKVHIESNGKMMLTRVATPANLRKIASEFTGVQYKASRKGLETAYADLCNMEVVRIDTPE